mgnify:CR=1 FL=1
MSWFYSIGRFIVRLLLFLLIRWQVRGRENVPDQGAILVVANHLSVFDPPLLGAGLGRRVVFMAKEELFHPRFQGYFIRSLGAFPVRRGGRDRKALSQAGRVLADGLALVMFPEGRRSKNAQLQPAFAGSALIALRSGVPVIPVGITGTERIKGVAWWLRRPRVIVNVGCPFYLPSAGSSPVTKVELTRLADYMMGRVAELLPQQYWGSYTREKSDGVEN